VVEHALERIGWQGRAILAAGRTDSGVHAAGQVIAFDLEWSHSAETLQAALNANLPPAVAVQAVSPTRPDFHPRFDALARRYQYRIFCAPA
jgi:tRNA pseudouridine38-40 synthase